MTDFKPGDKVKDGTGQVVAIEAGPFRGPSGDVYAVCAEYEGWPASEAWVILAQELSPIPPADPRVDVVRNALAEYHNTSKLQVSETCWEGAGHEARAILAALDAMKPERVEDVLGDVWARNSRGTWDLTGFSEATCELYSGYTWHKLDDEQGPLTPLS